MHSTVCIRFKPNGKAHLVNPGELEVSRGNWLVVETPVGERVAEVINTTSSDIPDEGHCLKTLRMATAEDLEAARANEAKESEAMRVCAEKVKLRNLPMKLINAEYALDGQQVIINFASDNRVDFRELVRDVASIIKSRVIFHQVGVRDHARAVGLYGHCGQQLCCARFLTALEPVTIKMAKDQSLAINPAKFSGICGKLMCCLRFEHDIYVEEMEGLPYRGEIVDTQNGPAEVIDFNIITKVVHVRFEDATEQHLVDGEYNRQNGRGRFGANSQPCCMEEEFLEDLTD